MIDESGYIVEKISRLNGDGELEDLTHKNLGELLKNYKLQALTFLDKTGCAITTYREKNGDSILFIMQKKKGVN